VTGPLDWIRLAVATPKMEYQYLLLIFGGPINVFVERMRSQRADKLTFVAIFLYYADGIWIAAESLEDGLDYLCQCLQTVASSSWDMGNWKKDIRLIHSGSVEILNNDVSERHWPRYLPPTKECSKSCSSLSIMCGSNKLCSLPETPQFLQSNTCSLNFTRLRFSYFACCHKRLCEVHDWELDGLHCSGDVWVGWEGTPVTALLPLLLALERLAESTLLMVETVQSEGPTSPF